MARSSISSDIAKLSKQKTIPAVVTDVLGNLCSVRLSIRGTRLHGLKYMGTKPVIGETVYVNYQSGTPVVYTVTGNVDSSIASAVAQIPSSSSGKNVPLEPPMMPDHYHNDHLGLQGGAENEQYHLNADERGMFSSLFERLEETSISSGGQIAYVNNWKYHIFQSDGTLSVTEKIYNAQILVVGGGGGGGSGSMGSPFTGGGGGGGGGVIMETIDIEIGDYPVTCGGAGPAGFDGGDSVFDMYTAIGGGAGAGDSTGHDGGSGGGGCGRGGGVGGAGTTGQGYDGGAVLLTENTDGAGGGGGGGQGNDASGIGGGTEGGLPWGYEFFPQSVEDYIGTGSDVIAGGGRGGIYNGKGGNNAGEGTIGCGGWGSGGGFYDDKMPGSGSGGIVIIKYYWEVPSQYVAHWYNEINPTINDDSVAGYAKADIWINQSTQISYICIDNAAGNAIWLELGSGGSGGGSVLFKVDGVLAVVDGATNSYVFTTAASISEWYVCLRNPGTAGQTIPDLILNGTTSIFLDDYYDNRPVVPFYGANSWVVATPLITNFVAGDIITLNIDEVANGAADLVIVGGHIGSTIHTDIAVSNDTVFVPDVNNIVFESAVVTDNGGGQVTVSVIGFSEDITTEGVAKNRNTTGSFTYQEQPIIIYRPIKLISVQWDIRVAGNYTLSIRDENGTIIEDVIVAGIGAVSADNVFTLVNPRPLRAGAYRLRMTNNAGACLWSDKNTNNFFYPAWNQSWVTRQMNYDGTTFSNYTAPFDLNFYDSILE